MLSNKLRVCLLTLCAAGLLSGCAANRTATTDRAAACAILPAPFRFHSEAEIMATPERPLAYIESYASSYASFCGGVGN